MNGHVCVCFSCFSSCVSFQCRMRISSQETKSSFYVCLISFCAFDRLNSTSFVLIADRVIDFFPDIFGRLCHLNGQRRVVFRLTCGRFFDLDFDFDFFLVVFPSIDLVGASVSASYFVADFSLMTGHAVAFYLQLLCLLFDSSRHRICTLHILLNLGSYFR